MKIINKEITPKRILFELAWFCTALIMVFVAFKVAAIFENIGIKLFVIFLACCAYLLIFVPISLIIENKLFRN